MCILCRSRTCKTLIKRTSFSVFKHPKDFQAIDWGQINPRCQTRTIKYIIRVTVAKGYVEIDQELCKGCQLCIYFCPKSSINTSKYINSAGYQFATFNSNGDCTGCAICAMVCPEVAIEVYRD